MFGTGLFFGMLAVALGKEAKANYDIKKSTSRYDEKGNLHYIDNQCRDYINGERVKTVRTVDANGVPLYSTVGVTSSHVYDTRYGRGTQQLFERSEWWKQENIKYGYLAYMQFNPYFERSVLTEISTGRTITCLFKNEFHGEYGKNQYRKWYFRPECQGKYDYNKTVDGDYGIPITKEEYDKLNVICSTARILPNDIKVCHDLMDSETSYLY